MPLHFRFGQSSPWLHHVLRSSGYASSLHSFGFTGSSFPPAPLLSSLTSPLSAKSASPPQSSQCLAPPVHQCHPRSLSGSQSLPTPPQSVRLLAPPLLPPLAVNLCLGKKVISALLFQEVSVASTLDIQLGKEEYSVFSILSNVC